MTPREFIFFCEGMNIIWHNHEDFSTMYNIIKSQYSKEADNLFVKGKGGTVKDVVDVLDEVDELKDFFGVKRIKNDRTR